MEITESRIVKVENKVVTLKDLRTLATILLKTASVLEQESVSVKFSVSCFDESKFTSANIELFDEDSILAPKRIKCVRMNLSSYPRGADIDIEISHGSSNSTYSNKIEVTGNDNNWVNGTLVKLEESLITFSPQNTFCVDHRYSINAVIATGVGLLYMYLIVLFPSEPSENPQEWAVALTAFFKKYVLFEYLFKYVASFLFGWFPGLFVMDKLQKLWPAIELQVGPEHMLIEKSRRKWLGGVFLIAIAPLCTSVIYDIGKYLALANGS
jgi:hypothetical protein